MWWCSNWRGFFLPDSTRKKEPKTSLRRPPTPGLSQVAKMRKGPKAVPFRVQRCCSGKRRGHQPGSFYFQKSEHFWLSSNTNFVIIRESENISKSKIRHIPKLCAIPKVEYISPKLCTFPQRSNLKPQNGN